MKEHHSAVQWDFRRYLHLPLSEVGKSVTYGEAWGLIQELMRETGSHLTAAIAGMHRALSWSDLALIRLAEAYIETHKDAKKHPKPIRMFEIWQEQDPNADVTPERRAELAAQLERRSAFR